MSTANTPHLVLLHHEQDKLSAEQLSLRLKPHVRQGRLTLWSSLQLRPGEPLSRVDDELERADQVALLLSVYFLASDELHDICRWLKERGKAMIPVVVGAIDDTEGEPYHGLLPIDVAKIMAEEGEDVAWAKAVLELRKALESGLARVGTASPSLSSTRPVQATARASRVDASSPDAAGDALNRLMGLLPSQFELVLFHLGVDVNLLPGAGASQAERAIVLMRLIKQQDRMGELLRALVQL